MLTQSEKNEFLKKLRRLVESNFTGVDVCSFVRENKTAQYLLGKVSFTEYERQIDFIVNHDDCEIEEILKTHHMDYHDSDYGSLDPLIEFRINKTDYEDDDENENLSFENLEEHDNVLSHMLLMLNEEDTEIPLSEILNRDNLIKLVDGGYDCQANQIYYFEKLEFGKFMFTHYFRDKNGWDSCEYKMDFSKPKEFVERYFQGYSNPTEAECCFYYKMENAYREFLDKVDSYLPLYKAVYNGVEAMNIFKEKTYPFVQSLINRNKDYLFREE